MYSYDRPCVLAVENPLDSTLDVGKNSYNMPLLKTALAEAYTRLHNVLVSPPAGEESREGGRGGEREGGLRLLGLISGMCYLNPHLLLTPPPSLPPSFFPSMQAHYPPRRRHSSRPGHVRPTHAQATHIPDTPLTLPPSLPPSSLPSRQAYLPPRCGHSSRPGPLRSTHAQAPHLPDPCFYSSQALQA